MELPISIAQCKHGVMRFLAHDVIVGQSLALYGEWSDREVGFLEQLVSPGASIIECGANIGAHTVPLAKHLGPEGSLIAFEPQRVIYDLLIRNLETNGCLDRVAAIHAAVGREMGKARLPAIDYADASKWEHPCGASLNGSADGEEVEVVTIDSLRMTRVDLIKADIEGFEAEALEGARATIARCRPLLYIENDKLDRSAALIALIRSLGYRLFWHLPPLFDSENFRGCQRNVYPHMVSVNMLCVPEERPVRLKGLREILCDDEDWKLATRPYEMLRHAPAEGQKTVAVLRPGVYGDALMASSAIAGLKRQGWHVTVYTEGPGEEILRHDPNVDRLLWLPREEVTIADICGFFFGEQTQYDHAVSLVESVERNLLAIASDIAFYWPHEARAHQFAGNYLEQIHRIAGVAHEPTVKFYPKDRERLLVRSWADVRRPLVLIAVSGSTLPKFWPHVGEFARRLAGNGIHVALAGDLRELKIEAHERIHVLGTTWPMREVLTLAQMADAVIGQETGILNAVAFEPVPKVVLLSHSSRENLTRDWMNATALHGAAPCYPCHRNHTAQLGFRWCNQDQATGAALCQALISPEEVDAELTRLLGSIGQRKAA